MKNLKIFENEDFGEIRTVEKDGEVWFVGKDICQVFGDKNHNRTLGRLEEEDKGVVKLDTLGGKQDVTIINESGLYSVLFTLQPQKANNKGVSYAYPLEVQGRIKKLKMFKRWVTSDVLPSIRKHGMYAADYLIANPDIAIEAFKALKAERKKALCLSETVAVQKQQISEMKPKASYYDLVLNCKNLISTTAISKDYGKSAVWLNKKLHEMKVQYKQGSVWVLYQKYAEQGYTSTKTHPITKSDGTIESKPHTYWTQKGRLFIYEQLKTLGILPIIEREEK